MRITRKPKGAARFFVARPIALAVLLAVALAGPASLLQAQVASEAPRLFDLLELKPGMTVGEIGAGRGEMTIEMAKRVGPSGRVYSTELDPARLADIREAVSREQLTNVTVITAGERASNLPAACCDAIFMRDVYHHFTHPEEIARSLAASLKPGGRLAIIDFEPQAGMAAPEGVPANREGHGIRPEIIVAEITPAGPSAVRTIPDWSNPRANRRMFLVLFKK
jgi:cyclopropane fatty-acyl-phospholipid synthase-like methyltransferase